MVDENKKVWIKNLCNWDLYFGRIESNGEVRIPANGKLRLPIAEIQSQVYDQNIMFVGLDGHGSHARIFIDDKETRVHLEFEEEDNKSKQEVLDKDVVKKLFDYKTQKSFEDNVKKKVKTQAEKNYLIEEAKRQNVNDHNKIKFIEKHTGYKFNEDE